MSGDIAFQCLLPNKGMYIQAFLFDVVSPNITQMFFADVVVGLYIYICKISCNLNIKESISRQHALEKSQLSFVAIDINMAEVIYCPINVILVALKNDLGVFKMFATVTHFCLSFTYFTFFFLARFFKKIRFQGMSYWLKL